MINYVKGDILEAQTQVIVNTVNCVGVMGKGLALQYKYKFPDMYEKYRDYCKKKKLLPGQIFLYPLPDKRVVFNVATKDHWKDPSKIEWIYDSVKNIGLLMNTYQIKSISIPKLGCQNGRLTWDKVRPIIETLEFIVHAEINIYDNN
jgi:O-acetyl-ADP-ribose deacetylase (regulator of RNase III)